METVNIIPFPMEIKVMKHNNGTTISITIPKKIAEAMNVSQEDQHIYGYPAQVGTQSGILFVCEKL